MAVSVSHNIRMVPTSINNNFGSKKEKQTSKRKHKKNFISRTIAIEQTYVYDVYSMIATNTDLQTISPVRSYVKQFLFDFEPGSILLDIGCSDGQYMNLQPNIVVIGLEHCSQWFQHDNYKLCMDPKYLLLGNVLYLPFRDELFDGILCCSVLHHLSTLERRIRALKEIARILKIGGRILLTVSSGSNENKNIRSQDVLIKVNNFKKYSRHQTESDADFQSYIGSTTKGSTEDYNNELPTCEAHNSPSNSELENCYSFFKKAIKRFSLTSNIYPFKNSLTDATLTPSIFNIDEYPIELRNLDDDKFSYHSSKSSSTDVDSALSSFNRSSGCISQTSSNTMFPSSILSVIKEHLISWKTQFTSSIEQWQSFEINDSGEDKKDAAFLEKNDQNYHRFSLPISFWKGNNKHDVNNNNVGKNKLAKNKIYASNGFEKMILPLLNEGKNHKDLRLNELFKQKIEENSCFKKLNQKNEKPDDRNDITHHHQEEKIEAKENTKNFTNRILLQKSFSSESSRQSSIQCYHYKLLAYYSMPELNSLFALLEKEDFHQILNHSKNNPIQSDKHKGISLNGIEKNESHFHFILDEKLNKFSSKNKSEKTTNGTIEILNRGTEPLSNIQSSERKKSITEMPSTSVAIVQKPKAIDASKFTKKLLRQRSFSADYQPEIVKLQPDPPRRFSASPNIETHRYNKVEHIPHQQQISMDSEESFVTIIPANRSIRENVNYSDTTDFDPDEEDECTSNQIISSNEIYSYSSSEEEAYCESLGNDQNTSNDTSISSVLEATIKSISASDSMDSHDEITTISSMEEISRENSIVSPPTTLHQYYHLFRNGELEQMIEEHVQNLHVIDSFYNEYAMSWCVVAEKIHVWTI